jgi:hypothetical protein
MDKKYLLVILAALLCLTSRCNVENEGEKTPPTPAASSGQQPSPNPNFSAKQRELIVQMYKEAVMLNERYEAAFEAKDKDLFNQARGIGYALVRRDEKNEKLNENHGMTCWLAFASMNESRNSQWDTYQSDGKVSDYAEQQLIEARKSLEECKSVAESTGIFNAGELSKPLPYLKPVEVE